MQSESVFFQVRPEFLNTFRRVAFHEEFADSSVGIATRLRTGWTIGILRFDSRRVLGIFLFATASRTAQVPTQPPI
jgi:hypothetical protein